MLFLAPLTNSLWHIVFANVILFLFISIFIYRNSKDKVFKYYALYNLFLLGYLIFKNGITINYFNLRSVWSINWSIQIIYNTFVVYFGIQFLNLKAHYPKSIKVISYILSTFLFIAALSILGAISTSFGTSNYLFLFYSFIFLPMLLIMTIYLIVLILRIIEPGKYYYLVGVSCYIVLAMTAFIMTLKKVGFHDTVQPIGYFYMGVIIEEYVFAFGLGKRVKKIYADKINIQKQLTETQKALNLELKSKIKKIEVEKQLADLEYTVLTSKMNSHFIFNALNSIKLYIIENEPQNAIHYLQKFSTFIRKVLETSLVKSICLEEELLISKLYMEIENSRFENTIDFSVHIDNELSLKDIFVPPFILQPFLENAIWHGIASKDIKKITLSFFQEDDNIQIRIIDNGIGRKRAKEIRDKKAEYKKSMGLQIVTQMLTNYYQDTYHLSYIDKYDENSQAAGTEVVLEIPVNC